MKIRAELRVDSKVGCVGYQDAGQPSGVSFTLSMGQPDSLFVDGERVGQLLDWPQVDYEFVQGDGFSQRYIGESRLDVMLELGPADGCSVMGDK